MKIVFLDIDGVLATARSFEQEALDKHDIVIKDNQHLHLNRYPLDPIAVDQLNTLTKESGAKIVISSSWRFFMDLPTLQGALALEGVKGEIIDQTPWINNVIRGQEIAAWINANPVEAFTILDDDDDMGELTPWLVQTDFERGLDSEDVQKALYMLGEYT